MIRALITNDDGIESPGLRALAEAARCAGLEPVVTAPCWDSSGASAALTGVQEAGELLFERHFWTGWEGSVMAVNASPAMISWVALRGGFGPKPDLVLSGINRGPNTGRAILHSGTVGAALTAYNHGCPALAMSLDVRGLAAAESDPALHWSTAAFVAEGILAWLRTARDPVILNCNVPNVPTTELMGVRHGTLATVGAVETTVTDRTDGSLRLELREVVPPNDPTTDAALINRNYASVTALVPIAEDSAVDLSWVAGSI